MRATTDADYNSASRYLEYRIDIYFDGANFPPMSIYKDTYLEDSETFEEIGFETDSPVQTLANNEIDFVLDNHTGIFTPSNASSPLYGKIKPGVMMKAYIRPVDDEIEWDSLGTYYVVDWNVPSGSNTASVTGYDASYNLTSDTDLPFLPVVQNDTSTFLQAVVGAIPLSILGTAPTIPYLFPRNTRRETVEDIINALQWSASCNRAGTLLAGKLPFYAEQHVFTDNDQIFSIEIPQSFIKQYDDATLSYYVPSILRSSELLNIRPVDLTTGVSFFRNAVFNSAPALAIEHIHVSCENLVSTLLNSAAALSINFEVNNTAAPTSAEIVVIGTLLSLAQFDIIGTGRSVKVQNEFVQTVEAAEAYHGYLHNFVNCYPQTITIRARGNARIQLGSRVRVNSTKYKLNFNGVAVQCKHSFAGSLSAEYKLLNLSAIGAS